MKNLKGGRLCLPLKIGANPKIFHLSKTPLGTWDALTPPEVVDCTSPSEDVSSQDERPKTPSKAPDKTPWPKLRVFQNPR
jgi:hypothetical protein